MTDARNILLGSVKLCAGKGAALPHIIPGRDVGDLIDGLASMGHTERSAHQGRAKSARRLYPLAYGEVLTDRQPRVYQD